MNPISPIKYTVYDQELPSGVLPIVETYQDSMAYGSILISIDQLSNITDTTAELYRAGPPTINEERWTRLQPALDTTSTNILSYETKVRTDGFWQIDWQMQPDTIQGIAHDQHYSLEFYVNPGENADVAQIAPKLIIKINDRIGWTGETGFQGVTGLDSVQGVTGAQGVQGDTGVQGIQGETGIGGIGETGIQGATGPSGGEQGVTGIQGETGVQGVTGAAGGSTGAQGATGVQGETGAGEQGVTGVQGIQGQTGIAGIDGQTGIQGETGVQGTQGDQGETGAGIQGETGVQGIQGQQGETGVQGQTGAGIQGETGVQGIQGETGAGIQGDTGVAGVTGPIGPGGGDQGETGVQGIQGQTGVQGETGAGIQGETGVQGIQGDQGETGAGIQGETGTAGIDGQTGIQGETGVQGIQGETGTAGEDGVTGIAGIDGQTGVQGETGVQGIQGDQGETGVQGVQGQTGIQGTTGVQGNTGTSVTAAIARNEPTGFVNRTDSTMSFAEDTRTFTIDTDSTYSIWQAGTEYERTDSTSTVITDVHGTHFFYFDDNILNVAVNPSNGTMGDIIENKVITSVVYWDSTADNAPLFAEERHGMKMDGRTHVYLHKTRGTQYVPPGLFPDDFDIDGNGDDDSASQFSVSNGQIYDEDIFYDIVDDDPQDLDPIAEIPIIYQEGSAGTWKIHYWTETWSATTAYPSGTRIRESNSYFESDGGTSGGALPDFANTREPGDTVVDNDITWTCVGSPRSPGINFNGGNYRLAYNEDVAGTWQQTEITNTDFVLTHVFATPDLNHPVMAIQGQNEYGSVAAARAGALTEINNLVLTGLPFPEIVFIATMIYQTNNGYSNQVKGRLRSTGTGDNFVDWRFDNINSASTGDKGDQGETGVQGATGVQGIQGQTGAGIQGATGVQGIQGETGIQGLQGDQGETGVAGETGVQGIQGETGVQGIQGDRGETGVQGIQGNTGVQGIQGDQGETGVQGIQGDQGETGVQGVAGVGAQCAVWQFDDATGDADPGSGKFRLNNATQSSATASYIDYLSESGSDYSAFLLALAKAGNEFLIQEQEDSTRWQLYEINTDAVDASGYIRIPSMTHIDGGSDVRDGEKCYLCFGVEGEQGVTGVQGATGVQGIQGDQGETGVQGIQGETGVQGIQGDQGETGVQGIQGNTGVQGIQGDQGETGVQGIQGDQGETGVQGTQGETGVQGIQGDQGDTGVQGTQGDQGETGVQGIQGQTGVQGIQGQTGAGVQGETGVQGTQGETGVSLSHTLGLTVESATSSEDITMFKSKDAITISNMYAVLVGTDATSVTWTVRHDPNRSNAGNEVITGGTTTTSTTTGDSLSSFDDPTIPANSWVWWETTDSSGTNQINTTIVYDKD